MLKFAFIASGLAILAAPAGAQAPVTEAPPSREVATTDSSDARRIVCKREEVIGSRLGAKKVCLTVQEWEDRAKADRDSTENVQRLSTMRNGT